MVVVSGFKDHLDDSMLSSNATSFQSFQNEQGESKKDPPDPKEKITTRKKPGKRSPNTPRISNNQDPPLKMCNFFRRGKNWNNFY